jgi:hypothetical protein
MGHGGTAWKWPLCGAATAALILVVLLIPRHWIDAFFSPLDERRWAEASRPEAVLRLLPVPTVIPATEPPEQRTDRPDEEETIPETLSPAWWEAAWSLHVAERSSRQLEAAPADTAASDLLLLLGAASTADLLARPDSVLADRLAVLRVNNRAAFERVRGMLKGATSGRRWQGILRQAARVHGEDALQEPDVPDRER